MSNFKRVDLQRLRKTYPYTRVTPTVQFLTNSNVVETCSSCPETGSWILITGTEQGAAPYDPGGYAATGTTFVPANGTFLCNFATGAPAVFGYQENFIRWTTKVIDVFPNINMATDIIQIFMTGSVPTSTARHGITWGILDGGTGSISSNSGSMMNLNAQNGVTQQLQIVGSGSTVQSRTVTGTFANGVMTSYFFGDKGGTSPRSPTHSRSLTKLTNNAWIDGITSTDEQGWAIQTASNLRFHWGFVHITAAAGATNLTGSFYVRLIKSGSQPPFF